MENLITDVNASFCPILLRKVGSQYDKTNDQFKDTASCVKTLDTASTIPELSGKSKIITANKGSDNSGSCIDCMSQSLKSTADFIKPIQMSLSSIKSVIFRDNCIIDISELNNFKNLVEIDLAGVCLCVLTNLKYQSEYFIS